MHLSNTSALRTAMTRLGAVVAIVFGLAAVSMAPASAHHPELSGTADCAGKVSWTTEAWSGPDDASRTNTKVEVYKSVDGGSFELVETGQYLPENSFTFSGTFNVGTPLPDSVTLRVKAVNDWGNGSKGGQTKEAEVKLPNDCEPPTEPAATVTANCEGVTAVLDNSKSTDEVTYTVTTPQGTTETHTVPGGESKTLTYDAVAGATTSVTADGLDEVSATGPTDCAPEPGEPGGTITVDCDGFVVTLDNSEGTEATEFTVSTPTGDDEVVTVEAGETTELSYPVVEDENSTVTVLVGDEELATASYSANCEPTTNPGEPEEPSEPGKPNGPLPDTGNPVNPVLVALALGLVVLGGGLLAFRTRLTRVMRRS